MKKNICYIEGNDLVNACLGRRFDADMNARHNVLSYGQSGNIAIVVIDFGEGEVITFKLKEVKGDKRHYFTIVSETCW